MGDYKYKKAICWLRRDLRLSDHHALFLATHQAETVYVVFVYDSLILGDLKFKDDRRLTFIHQSVEEINQALLNTHGQQILTAHGDPSQIIPQLALQLQAEAIFVAHDDEPYAIQRDRKVSISASAEFHSCKDHVIFEKQEVLSQSAEPYRVYTPYSRQWFSQVSESSFQDFQPDTTRISTPKTISHAKIGNHTLHELGFTPNQLWLKAGETAAHQQLQDFLPKLSDYKANRDFPDLESTSGLSVHLRFGTISIRECFRQAAPNSSAGSITWQKELVWREFYHMILANFPEVAEGKTFRPEYEQIDWPGTETDFTKWCNGKTGYPLVDAAMRCLVQTGWMHNRLRMVTAMFLTKDLLVDWRKGEEFFADHLLDFEFASNNGGWQWSASTGADGQPYFRIFNPLIQSRKFDPTGSFIRKYCPELAHLDDKEIHWPFNDDGTPSLISPPDYPLPAVNHHEQKPKVMSLFQSQPRS